MEQTNAMITRKVDISSLMPKPQPPNLDEFLPDGKKNLVTYMEGAKYYSINYYAFVKLAKAAGANIKIKKRVVVDLDLVEEYVAKNCKGDGADGV